jgi:chaperone required for assembly of F1-ATPase
VGDNVVIDGVAIKTPAPAAVVDVVPERASAQVIQLSEWRRSHDKQQH